MRASSSSRTLLRASTSLTRPAHRSAARVARPTLPLATLPLASPRHCVLARRTFFSLPDITKLAGLTSAVKDVSGIETDGEEQRFHARKILPYTSEQLYAIIADVPSYSSFIPFCTSSSVLVPGPWKPDGKPFDVEAELTVGFGGLEERYTSRVVGRPYESVTATATEQSPLFKSLVTTWSFSPASSHSPHASSSPPVASSTSRLPNDTRPTASTPEQRQPGPTLLTIDLAFTFANPLHRIASQAVLPKVAEKMVDAFETRCLEVWGQGRQ